MSIENIIYKIQKLQIKNNYYYLILNLIKYVYYIFCLIQYISINLAKIQQIKLNKIYDNFFDLIS